MRKRLVILALLLSIASLVAAQEKPIFTENEFTAHMRFLSSDVCEGRALGTRGIQVAAEYIAAQFEAMGLEPISAEAGYFQDIPLRGFKTDLNTVKFSLEAGGKAFNFKSPDNVIANSEIAQDDVSISGDLLFVGYGIEASEYDWDDYKGTDITGKIVVMLVNDPDLEKTGFADESLSFYGRYTYKEIQARNRGAKGLILIHTTPSATYPFAVVQSSWSAEKIFFADAKPSPLLLNGWITHTALNEALAGTDINYEKMLELATSREFKPFVLPLKIDVSFQQATRNFESANVIGILPGTEMKDEVIVLTGHYDHLGIGIADPDGDNIYNGASDNASGIATIISLARSLTEGPAPKRTLLFMANTGEEVGLMGSTYYVEHPVFPLEKTILAFNKDVSSLTGKRSGFGAFPIRYTDAIPTVTEIGNKHGLKLAIGGVDRAGGAFRSDHFSFAARGIVTFSVGLRGDNTSITKEEEAEMRKNIGYTYHQPSDEMNPYWRYDGTVLEMELIYDLVRYWADGATAPKMKDTNPFVATMKLYNEGK
jgi:Zn-dependent M28 family amino/carboxypeptidase